MNTHIKSPMLAPSESLDLKTFRDYPVYVSPKYDGIRCIINNGEPVSRTLKPIPNNYIRSTLQKLNLPHGLDGELITFKPNQIYDDGEIRDSYNDVQAKVMSRDGEPSFVYYIFDIILPKVIFEDRRIYIRDLISSLTPSRNWIIVTQDVIRDVVELVRLEEEYLDKGYEGLIIKSPQGYYKQGRCTYKEGIMWKLKRFEDSEARIVGMKPAYYNLADQEDDGIGNNKRPKRIGEREAKDEMGALTVVDIHHPEWGEFDIGTGFTHSDRISFWLMRMTAQKNPVIIKYKFQRHGMKDKPRSPVFLGFRTKEDL